MTLYFRAMEELLMLAKNIKLLRELHDYTQEHVAGVLNISQNTYSMLEKGESRLTIDRLGKLAELYNMSVSDILRLNAQTIIQNVTNNSGGFSHSENVHVSVPINDKERDFYQRTIMNQEKEIDRLRQQLDEIKKVS